ncbi:hypothetical protein [Avibacterium paragallinarum]|uniref:Uncharacterized protein n=1 Tax=Avibacterium paragallinarum TaxID=728 RepID=A0ABU7QRG2_AVIPA|nr:hypothetical protein [Avibacterium paragallinarum]
MAQQKITLPPRKWYSLEQAAEKLTRESGELVTIDDLLHFYVLGKLDLSVFISRFPATITIGSLTFSKHPQNENTYKFNRIGFNLIEYPKKKIDIDTFLIQKGAKFTISNKIATIETYSKEFEDFIYINGFMNIYVSTESSPIKEREIKEKGIFMNGFLNYLAFIDEDLGQVIAQINIQHSEDIYLPLDDLYILDKDLDNLINGTAHRDYIAKAISANKGRIEHPNKPDILRIAKATFQIYPKYTRNALANAIREYAKNVMKIHPNPTLKTYGNWLKEWEIGYKGKDFERDTKKLKVIDLK